MAFAAQQGGIPTCFFVFDNWLSKWEYDAWFSIWCGRPRRLMNRFGKKLVGWVLSLLGLLPFSEQLDLHHVHFGSHYLKQVCLDAGKPVRDGKVIHWGIDVNQFPYKKFSGNRGKLLFVGQIVQHKGLETLIEALRIIVKQKRNNSFTLTIVGGTIVPGYESYIHNLVSSYGLDRHVYFNGFISHERLPSVYQEHDVLIFPSLWEEPFGITILEGMSSGLAVVGTATGGSAEILHDEVNALVFQKGNAEACSRQILRLMDDQKLYERIRKNCRFMVEEEFRFETIMDKIENSLAEIAVK